VAEKCQQPKFVSSRLSTLLRANGQGKPDPEACGSTPSGPPFARGGKGRRPQARCDWRGWIALAWVLWFGWLYSVMVLETKFPQVLTWLHRAMAALTGQR
jgi:hypothetical protein